MKYVVECHKLVRAEEVGLNNERGVKWYRPGHFITYEGHPTSNIDEAHVYDDSQPDKDLELDEPFGPARNPRYLSDYFRKVPVATQRVLRTRLR